MYITVDSGAVPHVAVSLGLAREDYKSCGGADFKPTFTQGLVYHRLMKPGSTGQSGQIVVVG